MFKQKRKANGVGQRLKNVFASHVLKHQRKRLKVRVKFLSNKLTKKRWKSGGLEPENGCARRVFWKQKRRQSCVGLEIANGDAFIVRKQLLKLLRNNILLLVPTLGPGPVVVNVLQLRVPSHNALL